MTDFEKKISISYNDRAKQESCPICNKLTQRTTPIYIQMSIQALCSACAKEKVPLLVDILTVYFKQAMRQKGFSDN